MAFESRNACQAICGLDGFVTLFSIATTDLFSGAKNIAVSPNILPSKQARDFNSMQKLMFEALYYSIVLAHLSQGQRHDTSSIR